MPYKWSSPAPNGVSDDNPASLVLEVWPHRSLSASGFVVFIGATAACISLPLISLLGSPVLWVMLPFLSLAIGAIWFALRKNSNDRLITERLSLSRDSAHLSHHVPRHPVREWQANPYWIKVNLKETGGPVEHYLTLSAPNCREVELGRFLSPEERTQLAQELKSHLAQLR